MKRPSMQIGLGIAVGAGIGIAISVALGSGGAVAGGRNRDWNRNRNRNGTEQSRACPELAEGFLACPPRARRSGMTKGFGLGFGQQPTTKSQ